MSRLLGGVAAIAISPGLVMAKGLDRSGQPVDILFEEGNYFEFSIARVDPDVSGEDLPFTTGDPVLDTVLSPLLGAGAGASTGNVAEAFTQLGAAIKFQLTDRVSVALIADEPYGADIDYPQADTTLTFAPNPLGPTPPLVPVDADLDDDASNNLGGTRAQVDSSALTALVRYKPTQGIGVHGGLRYQRIDAAVRLQGLAYGIPGLADGLNGYEADFDDDWSLGYVIGASYEVPAIALRVALTYSSEIDHDLDYAERLGGQTVNRGALETTTPRSVNLDFQTGINDRTLAFGRIRWAEHSVTTVSPAVFDLGAGPQDGDSLTSLEDGFAYTLGLGRQLTNRLSGSVTIGYEPENDELIDPLSPTNGQRSIGLGLAYQATDRITVGGGVRYAEIGDSTVATNVPRAEFEDNDLIAVGLQIGYAF